MILTNLGVDRDILTTQKNLGDNELKFKHQLTVDGPKEKDIPRNYFVPNLGLDRDIVWTQNNLSATEKTLKTVWNPAENVQLANRLAHHNHH